MSDKPNDKPVPMNDGCVKQHHRMAAGEKVDGKTIPACPPMPKTPA